jgi:hypothetical protein
MLLLVVSCTKESVNSKEDSSKEEVTLKVGELVTVSGTSLAIEFSSVTNDSRCPIDVVCVWAGNAETEMAFHVPGSPVTVGYLNTFEEPREFSYAGYLIRLKDLKPYPKEGMEIDPNEYEVTLAVTAEN